MLGQQGKRGPADRGNRARRVRYGSADQIADLGQAEELGLTR